MNELHNIVFCENIQKDFSQWLDNQNYSQVFILVDQHTRHDCLPILSENLQSNTFVVIEIKSGENHKNLETCQYIWQKLTDFQADRNALVVNLGGGVIGDMGGFCAATYKRGIDFIQIPTTLLAQVDASVGGKLGVDFMGLKNHIGVFEAPKCVFLDIIFFKTLPKREFLAGFGEILKHCLIADAKMWENIAQSGIANLNIKDLVKHSVSIKAKIVAQDPQEKGLRKLLNFGHTLGHALETYLLQFPERQVLHGEAVAFGLIAESYISHKQNLLTEAQMQAIKHCLEAFFPKINLFETDIEPVLVFTKQDKKNAFQQTRLVLLESIGTATYDHSVSDEILKSAINYYLKG